jgi:hypothetical protein
MDTPTRDYPTHPTRRRVKKRERKTAQARFLAVLSRGLPVAAAAARAGVARDTVYGWREADAGFRAAWESAYAEGGDAIEEEAHRRGVEGWEEPVYQGGEQVGEVRRYSDRLLDRLLKGRKRDLYGEHVQVKATPPDDLTIRIVYTLRSATGEQLPDMEESELHAFWRWRDEQHRLKAAAQGNAGGDKVSAPHG